ncbi:MAG: signal peptidase I [Candidatus Saganbacteria bacterium]|nr:signal peptidase I [Candidatus Saganbacteria bacterium]
MDLLDLDLSAEESIKKFKITRLVGCSMYPTLQENDVLFLDTPPVENIQVGDMIVFKGQDKTICHRVVGKFMKKGKLFFKEKGDNCLGGSIISADLVIAKVKEYYRGRQKIQASNYWLARFNVLMAFVFKGIALGKSLKKRLIPNVRIGRFFKPIFRSIAKLNRIGNRAINSSNLKKRS